MRRQFESSRLSGCIWTLNVHLLTWIGVLGVISELRGESPDRVKTSQGTVSGTIHKTTPVMVVVKKDDSGETEIDVGDVEGIAFGGEPGALNQARHYVAARRYEEARQALAKVDVAQVTRDLIRDEIEFYTALCAARLALAGSGSVDEAGKAVFRFVSRAEESHHYFEACEVLAELLVNRGSYDRARPYLEKLEAAPWPETQWRSALLAGRALLAQAKYGEALARFEAVLKASGAASASDGSDRSHFITLAATIGKADCLAETGKAIDAIRVVEGVIARAEPEQAEVQALTHNALGRYYLKADLPKDALLAFLHVDVLYQSVPEAHAEALSRLAPLWESLGKADRAREARKVLSERYPDSRWAR